MPEQLSDETISLRVRQAVSGDRKSLGWVVGHFSPLLRAQAAHRLTPSPQLASDLDDIVAEAWLVALRRLGDLDNHEGHYTPRLLAFLSTTIVHLINRRLDASIRHRQITLDPMQSSGAGLKPIEWASEEITGVVTHAARGEISAAIENCLAGLADQDRQVVILRGIEGLSNQEVAKELEELPTTVSHRYQRALAKLRNCLPHSIFDELVGA